MNFEFDPLLTSTLAIGLLILGGYLKKRVHFFEKFCIPSPVIGGFIFALLIWIAKETGLGEVSLSPSLQSPAMILFFTTVGIGGSLGLFKKGGKLLIIYLCSCWFLAIAQSVIGVSVASLLGVDPILGAMAGAISLEGGHGAAASFGQTAVEMGHSSAMTVALAAATLGLIGGGLLGGPVANWLIKRNKITIPKSERVSIEAAEKAPICVDGMVKMFGLLLLLMYLGTHVVFFFKEVLNFALPSYVGAMIAAMIFRNLNDHFKLVTLRESEIDLLSTLALGLFLTMAMMGLKIWDLYNLALPILIILAVQIIFLVGFSVFVVFRMLGSNFDAAIMSAGFMGHGLGATPNAVANMTAVCEKYNTFSYKAFLIVPLSGAVLIDFVALPIMSWTVNYFG